MFGEYVFKIKYITSIYLMLVKVKKYISAYVSIFFSLLLDQLLNKNMLEWNSIDLWSVIVQFTPFRDIFQH